MKCLAMDNNTIEGAFDYDTDTRNRNEENGNIQRDGLLLTVTNNSNDDDDGGGGGGGCSSIGATTRRMTTPIDPFETEYTIGSGDDDDDDDTNSIGNDGMHMSSIGRRPFFFRYIPRCMRWDYNGHDDRHSPIEATGCAVDMYARATMYLVGIFVGPALLELASSQAAAEASCDTVEGDRDSCIEGGEARVYGFKPSSLLTNMGMVASLFSALTLPPTGAIIDYTHYRRHLGMYTAVGLTVIKLVELSLNQSTWFTVSCLQIVSGVLFQIHTTVVYAYSSELSVETSAQSSYQTSFFITMYISMLLFMVEVLIPGQIMDLSTVGTAKLSILVSCLNCIPLFYISWMHLFRNKPPIAPIPDGQSIWAAGFQKLYQTYTDIAVEYRTVNVFLLTIAFSEAADTALATIATTYLSQYLGFDGLEIGMVILIVLIAGVPGTTIGDFLTRRYDNPVFSVQVCLVMYIFVTALASIFLRAGTPKILAYVFGFLWGMCQGWMHPQHTTTFVTITPHQKGKGETELMGLFLFATQILGFLPPLVFTILNEAGYPMWLGLSTLIIYFSIGLIGQFTMGDYGYARRHAIL